jgi:hypothetical protein
VVGRERTLAYVGIGRATSVARDEEVLEDTHLGDRQPI